VLKNKTPSVEEEASVEAESAPTADEKEVQDVKALGGGKAAQTAAKADAKPAAEAPKVVGFIKFNIKGAAGNEVKVPVEAVWAVLRQFDEP
jgi:hypothetical protein